MKVNLLNTVALLVVYTYTQESHNRTGNMYIILEFFLSQIYF